MPKMIASGCIRYRHYLITVHALDRYIERIGGDAGDMITDIDNAWLFDPNQSGQHRRNCASAAIAERTGGYALSNNRVMFIVIPEEHHVIVTTLSMSMEKRDA
ncbi:hypothetical protein [Klebsiella michiganensis]|uniref:hypothetical protein n=1 Tax=Klebsiella michiganensis TaxID=1134687 RepID=UPI0012B9200B|nr:hypothetical protein [Klebsiella michiganensis]EJB5612749.1 hypothetical protein [Klebsiella oxytoca]